MTDQELNNIIEMAVTNDVLPLFKLAIDKMSMTDLDEIFYKAHDKMVELTGVIIIPRGERLIITPEDKDPASEYPYLYSLMWEVSIIQSRHKRGGATLIESAALLDVIVSNPGIMKGLKSDDKIDIYARILGTTFTSVSKTLRARVDKSDIKLAKEYIERKKLLYPK
jgi:hypothetical protein